MSGRIALIIGNSEYTDAKLSRLITPGGDAEDLSQVLRNPDIGAFDEVILLINESTLVVQREIARFFKNKKRDDLLLLYFSGHGVLDDQGSLYLATKDTECDLLSATAIPADFIRREMDYSRSRRQVLVLDCCHSGAFARGAKRAIGGSVGTATTFEGNGFGKVILTATDATQYAWEGNQIIGEAENSVFTHYLLQGLRTGQADRDGDGNISLDELYDYVYEQVLEQTPKQVPGKWSFKQQGEMIIAKSSFWVELQRQAAEEKRKAEEEVRKEAEAARIEKERQAAIQAEIERLMAQQVQKESPLETKTQKDVAEMPDGEPAKEMPSVFVPTPEREKPKVHPYVPEAQDLLQKGQISRRQFVYIATLLGCSVTAAAAAAVGGWSFFRSTDGTPEPTRKSTATTASSGGAASAGPIKRGGTFTSAMQLQSLDHPARLFWVEGANVVRQVGEYLTLTDENNITRPYLLERWIPSDDLKTWDLRLRQGITFSNGDKLTADDVMFSFGEWLDPDVGSSMLGLLSYIGGMENVEKVDDHTVRLHLEYPSITVPEHLFHYPAIILHRSFEGDFIREPVGTGPFTLEEYSEGERVVLKRREDYWQLGKDGQALPYLDEITYVSMDKDAAVAALQAGQVDSMYDPRPADWQTLKDNDELTVRSASTSQALILRMRVDLEPWSDVRVRNALKVCQDRAKILQQAYFGEGDLAIDAHIAPVHPEYCQKPIPEYDPEQAKVLLAEAGYPDGLQVTLATKDDQLEPEIAQALKELAAPAGFDITLDITGPAGYWDRWTEVDLGITSWTHRPLGTMFFPLAYTKDALGAWNETRWTDDEFEDLLRQAEGEVDVLAREKIMCQIEDIMQNRGPIGISFWKKIWNITRSEFKNVKAHPTAYDLLNNVWKDF